MLEEEDERTGGRPPGGALGPLVGLRRPNYGVLGEVAGPFLARQAADADLFLFVNLGSALRHLFSEYAVAKLSRSELRRSPRMLAAELINLGGHYRNFAWKHYGLRTTVIFYHSTKRCPLKVAAAAGYKEAYYRKRLDPPDAMHELVRAYADFNLKIAGRVAQRIPNMHFVDTGEIDPEAWPWALMAEGRVRGPAMVMSSYQSDLQYVLAPGEHERAVLVAKGEHTALVEAAGAVGYMLREAKTGKDLASELSPGHLRYLNALAGDEDLGVRGVKKFGPARAAAYLASRVRAGRLPPDFPSLASFLEDGAVDPAYVEEAVSAWHLLDHADYSARVSGAEMARIDSLLVDRSGLGELERANSEFFSESPISLEMAYAGEDY